MRFSYHTHTQYCDGKATAAEMAAAAAAAGYSFLGFTSHAPLPFKTSWNMAWEDLEAYASEVRAAAAAWRTRGLAIFLGLEIDYIAAGAAGAAPAAWPGDAAYDRIAPDFRLGSVHFLTGLADDEFTVDEPAGDFERHMAGLGNDAAAVWTQYYHNLSAMVDRGGFDILGHFDLVKKNNAGNRWFDEGGAEYLAAAYEAVDFAAERGCVAEINTGGLARGKIADVYPSAPILRRMRQKGLRLTLGDDAHAPEHLGAFQGAAIDAARSAGYKSLWYMDAPGSWKEIGIDELQRGL
jgi:histidinol-phosphatase (PHP family)